MNRGPIGLAIGTFYARELLHGLLRPSLAPQTRPSPMFPLPQTRRAQLPRPSLLVQLRVPQTTAVGHLWGPARPRLQGRARPRLRGQARSQQALQELSRTERPNGQASGFPIHQSCNGRTNGLGEVVRS